MNYIKELNAFYDSLELNPLSSSAIVLWYALMHMNNKSRWKCEFRVAATVLRIKSGLNESSFKRARIELKEKGYIAYEAQGGNRASVYRMISLVEQNDGARQVDSVVDGAVSTEKEAVGETVGQEGITEETVMKLEAGKGEGDVLVREAVRRARERNKMSWRYVKRILQIWEEKGIRSLDAVRADDVEFRKRKQQQYHYFMNGKRGEVIPDWFKEQKEKREKEQLEDQNKEMVVDPEEAEATRLEINRLKKELGYG